MEVAYLAPTHCLRESVSSTGLSDLRSLRCSQQLQRRQLFVMLVASMVFLIDHSMALLSCLSERATGGLVRRALRALTWNAKQQSGMVPSGSYPSDSARQVDVFEEPKEAEEVEEATTVDENRYHSDTP